MLKSEIGVPQGSNLGSLFFMIFFNDLLFEVNCDVDNFADDTTLRASGERVDEIENKLIQSCETVSQWMCVNKLKLNADKTHVLTVGTTQRVKSLQCPTFYQGVRGKCCPRRRSV